MTKCKRCGQEIPDKIITAMKRAKMEKVSAGLLARQASGFPIGRPKKLNDESVKKLYLKEGWSMTAIASHFKVTKSAIQGSLKRTKEYAK